MSAFVTTPLKVAGVVGLHQSVCSRTRRLRAKRSNAQTRVVSCVASQSAADAGSDIRYEDDGTRVVPVGLFLRGTKDETVAGAYGVLNSERELVFVGMNRNIAEGLTTHMENHGAEMVAFVKVMTFRFPEAAEMKMIVDTWVQENGSVPIGNAQQWFESDEKLAKEASLLPDLKTKQNEEVIVSPFESATIEASATNEVLDLTMENVDTVLEEVRPFLISDGGNVSVVSVNSGTGNVELQLQGACGSCASATVTMQLGIEKALREKFGDNLGEIVAIPSEDDVSTELSLQACEAALDQVRDALRGLGGAVSVQDIEDDEVILSFTGPNNLKYGIEMILKEKVPGVASVAFE